MNVAAVAHGEASQARRSAILLLATLAATTACDRVDPLALAEDRREPRSAILVRALEQGDVEQRLRAAIAAARIQSPFYAGPLREAARAETTEVRTTALWALGQIGLAEGGAIPDEAVEACREALRDTRPEVVAAAVQALGKLATPGAAEEITPWVRHPDAAVRAEAITALFRLRFVPVWRREAEEPPELPAASVEAVIGRFDDPVVEVRRAAAYAFARFGQPEAVAGLAGLVRDADEWTRLFAVRAIARSNGTAAAAAVRELLTDPSERVRTEAVQALARLGESDRIDPSSGSDASFHVRAAWARALAPSRRDGTVDLLRRLVAEDESVTVRAAALEALTERLGAGTSTTGGSTERIDALDQALDDGAWQLRVAAVRAAAGLGASGLPLARRAWADDDGRVRTAAIETAAALDSPLNEVVVEALASPDLAQRGTAVLLIAEGDFSEKLEWLERAYDGSPGVEWIEVRESIVDGLDGLAGGEELLLRIAGDDPAPSVRGRARRLLARDGDPASAPASGVVETPFRPGRAFEADPIVVLETTRGPIEIRCLAREAPLHVANFVRLVREGFYDGLTWHRVVSNFVIQGGDPRGDGWGGAGYTLRDEINRVPFERGAVGMPKAGKDTGSCQIFITHVPTPHLDGNYTVFGTVRAGMEAVDRIEVGDEIRRAYVLE